MRKLFLILLVLTILVTPVLAVRINQGGGGAGGSGDVTGPGSSTDNAVVRFNGAGGKTLQDSGVIVDDSDVTTTPGNIVLDDGSGASPSARFINAGNAQLNIQLDSGGNAEIDCNSGDIEIFFGDSDDYIALQTINSNIPRLTSVGGASLEIGASGGTISFLDDNLLTTGTLSAGAGTLTSLSATEGNLTNVGDVALDSLSSDGSNISIAATNSSDILQIGDGTYSWGNGPMVGIEGILEVDGNSFIDADLTISGTTESGTVTEGSNPVYNGAETPGGELGGTFASFTVDSTHSGSAHHAAVTVVDTTTIDFTLSTQEITADGLYVAGTSLTLTGASFDVDDDFLKLGGDVATSGVYDFGSSGVVLEVPNAAAPTTDATGEMAIDTDLITQGMLQVYLASAIANVVATTDTPGDNEVPTYDSGGGTIQWEAIPGGGFDSTTVDSTTWSDGANASNTWTFDVSGTDHTMTAHSGEMSFSGNIAIGTTTAPQIELEIVGGTPRFGLSESDGTSGERAWDFLANDKGTLYYRALNDAYSAAETWCQVDRVDATHNITSIKFFPGGPSSFSSGDDFAIQNTGFVYEADTTEVGIGTSNPGAKLNILQTAAVDSFRVDDVASDTTPFIINQSGNVGIGTSTAAVKLDVEDNIDANYVATFFNDGNGAGRHVIWLQGGTDAGGGGAVMVDFADGDGTSVGGNDITLSSGIVAYNTTSDLRAKKNIRPISGLDRVMSMNPVGFEMKDTNGYSEGFIAQEMREILPSAVSISQKENGFMGIDYGKLTPVLARAIQEQQELIVRQRKAISALERRLRKLEEQK